MLDAHFYHYSKRTLTTFYMSSCCGKGPSKQKSSKRFASNKRILFRSLISFLAPFSPKKQTGGLVEYIWQNREKKCLEVKTEGEMQELTFYSVAYLKIKGNLVSSF